MRSNIQPTSFALLAVLLSSCAGALSRENSVDDVRGSPAMIVEQLRSTFEAYRIPVASTRDNVINSRVFDPYEVWRSEQVTARVECELPKKPRPFASPHNMTLSVRAHVQPYNGTSSADPARPIPTQRATNRVSLASSGRRGDGANCRLTDEFANTLLASAGRIGGPMNRPDSQ